MIAVLGKSRILSWSASAKLFNHELAEDVYVVVLKCQKYLSRAIDFCNTILAVSESIHSCAHSAASDTILRCCCYVKAVECQHSILYIHGLMLRVLSCDVIAVYW